MKRTLVMLLAITMLLVTLVGCDGKKADSTTPTGSTGVTNSVILFLKAQARTPWLLE